MGHTIEPSLGYRRLQERLDGNVTGAPDSPVLMQILRLLFAPGEAELASRFPFRPTPVDELARRLAIEPSRFDEQVFDMARRGLVIDLERDGRRYVALAPVVIGFFEFTFMRARDDLPMKELAALFEQYMVDDRQFGDSVFGGQTQIGRSLVREEALPDDDHVEILDWERASRLVLDASSRAVSLCACRHKASHLEKACGAPLETCMTLNSGADSMVRAGIARPLDVNEAMAVLERSKEAGLAQTGDNVRREVSYICNCCGCCCGMMQAIRKLGIRNAIVTSNWIAETDPVRCRGCGRCFDACPAGAIRWVKFRDGNRKRARAEFDDSLCLGCGVCHSVCRDGAISMRPRERRVHTPETVFDRHVEMAIERGKLTDLVFDDAGGLGAHALARVLRALERSAPGRAALAIAPLKSVFLKGVVAAAKRSSPLS